MLKWLLLFVAFHNYAQSVIFDKNVYDYHFAVKNEANVGTLEWAGRAIGAKLLKIHISKDGKKRNTILKNLDAIGQFSVSATIDAGLYVYQTELYAFKSATDSVLITSAKEVVCGDIILIYGQSNAQGFTDEGFFWGKRPNGQVIFNDRFHRFLGDDYHFKPMKAETNKVGGLGFTLAEKYQNELGLPLCVVNYAQGGKGIYQLSENTPSSPYQAMIQKLASFKLSDKIKILIYRQGEYDVNFGSPCVECRLYPVLYDILYNGLKYELPNLKRIYNFQLNLSSNVSEDAHLVYEFQRKINEKYPDVVPVSSLNIKTWGYQFNHYRASGYIEAGNRAFGLIKKDFYNQQENANNTYPMVQKINYDANTKLIHVYFQEGQKLNISRPPADSIGQPLAKDFQLLYHFYINGQPGLVKEIKAEDNKLIFKGNFPPDPKTFSYLPSSLPTYPHMAAFENQGIFNQAGNPSFIFQNVPIKPTLEKPILTLTHTESTVHMRLETKTLEKSQVLQLFLKDQKGDFSLVASNPGSFLNYVPKFSETDTIKYFKTQVLSDSSASIVSEEIKIIFKRKLAPTLEILPKIEPQILSYTVNGIQHGKSIIFSDLLSELTTAEVYTTTGQPVSGVLTHKNIGQLSVKIPDNSPSQVYIIVLRAKNKVYSKKIFIE